MPLYMDRHFLEGATKTGIAHAHEKDLEIQEKHGVVFQTYWFDETRCTGFCLIEAPNKQAIQDAHDEAHGNVPHEIIEVDSSIVEAFLGRLKDPAPVNSYEESSIDSAFRAIMFTDLVDSTLMSTLYGDTRALHLLHIHNAITRNALRAYKGSEVKHTGDGIMASFEGVKDAVECAIAIQKGFIEHNKSNPNEELLLRIGLSAGEPIEEYGDFFGKCVQLAARLCSHAEPSQIVVAKVVYDECSGSGLSFSDMGEITPKGFDKAIQIFNIPY